MYSLFLKRPYIHPIIRISTNSYCLFTQILDYYNSFVVGKFEIKNESDILNVKIIGYNNHFECTVSDSLVEVVKDPFKMITSLLYKYREPEEDYILFHCGAVGIKEKAYIFLGPTHSGKTTLVTSMMMNGYDYISDDYVAMDCVRMSVQPNGNDIHLRKGGMDSLKKHYPDHDFSEYNIKQINSRFVLSPTNILHNPLPLGGIIFSKYGNECMVEEFKDKVLVTTLLLENHLVPPSVTISYLKKMISLLNYPCYRLYYSNLKQATDMINYVVKEN